MNKKELERILRRIDDLPIDDEAGDVCLTRNELKQFIRECADGEHRLGLEEKS